ncbi:Gfo/Idh/MocA family protein [Pelagibacterium montanilacus]|uniref:Gfo/Idh/MocA family protein n=1 Tax=Pelagibacterium montanilacus TaxID=2185280 RepID=UPI000F8D8369|nr:Gfo/Idh/MocA family oxidoreductase [Pelagibacterium montanilacus]
MEKLRIGVIGTGMIGSLHAGIYAANPRCDLVGVYDLDAERAADVAGRTGTERFDAMEALLDPAVVDAIAIATPETHRAAPALLAADRGIPMLLEKPLGRSLSQVDDLVGKLTAKKAYAAVNFILHADPRYASMAKLVAEGGIGRTVSFYARRRGSNLGLEHYAKWTDLLSSTLIHDIEMVLAVNGTSVERVFSEAVVRACEGLDSHDAIVATVRFADGAVAIFETSWVQPPLQPEPLEPAFHVIGDGGSVIIEGSSQGMKVLTAQRYTHPDMTHWPALPGGTGGALKASLDMFVDNLLAERPPLVGLKAARAAEAVVQAMKTSIATGMPVNVEPDGAP